MRALDSRKTTSSASRHGAGCILLAVGLALFPAGAAAQGDDTAEEYFRDWLTHQSGVYLNPGSIYGSGGEGHMRMNVASSRRVLREACEAMAAAVRSV